MQYLINATATWLLSLLVFDLFLRRQSYHAYNRFFLLFTFLLGALLPLLQWHAAPGAYPNAIEQPLLRVADAKQSLATAGQVADINWQNWLFYIYLSGILLSMVWVVADAVKLFFYYRSGATSYEQGWLVVETGKEHTPFSFRKMLFVSSRAQYADAEWQMILNHEARHTSLWHLADVVVMQLGRVVFWFHPLVYFYNNRLMLVHEYQADAVGEERPQDYGRFLVEQALLQSAPSISHSFNRSPIKNRITMLTKRSSTAARTRMLVFIPLAIVCFSCFTQDGLSQRFDRKGNVATYKGNKFTISPTTYDTVTMVDPTTSAERQQVVVRDPHPVAMNGKPIPEHVDETARFLGKERNLNEYLLRNLKAELSQLGDGMYTLNITNILVDEHGKVVYFEYNNMRRSKTQSEIPAGAKPVLSKDPKNAITISIDGGKPTQLLHNESPDFYEDVRKDLQDKIYDKVCSLMDRAPAYRPGTLDGKNVISGIGDQVYFWNHFKVKDHKVFMTVKGEFTEI